MSSGYRGDELIVPINFAHQRFHMSYFIIQSDVTKTRKGGSVMANEKYWSAVIPKKLSWSLRSTAKRRGLHVESDRQKVRIFIYQFSRVFGIIEFLFIKISQFDSSQLAC